MKKSLLALAAMGAFAGAAQAQSSVTVYGIADVGFTGISTRGIASGYINSTPITDAQNNTKITTNSFNSGNLATSRLGFRGTEDLGGGTSAFFTVEMGLNPTESTQFTTMTNRQSFVGLAQKGLGRAAIGTQYTPIFNAMTATNLGLNNTVVGSIIYPQATTAANTSEALTTRRNNSLFLQTERMSGFSLQGMYFTNNTNQTPTVNNAGVITAGGNTNSFGYGLGADFAWQKLYVTAAYHLNKNETSSSQSAVSTTAAQNLNDAQMFAGATYDFGILKAYVNWISRKATSTINSNEYVKRAGQQIGVRAPITKSIEAWANVGNGRYTSYGQGQPTANFNAWQLGTQYNMSKRTALYAIFGQNQTSSTTNAAGLTTSAAASQYAIGARHTF